MAKTKIPVYTGGDGSSKARAKAPTTKAPATGGGSKKDSKSGGGGESGGGMTSYEKRQNAKESKAQNKAATKYKDQSKTLDLQTDALRQSLSSAGFKASLQTRLANLGLVYGQQDASLLEGYGKRVESLKGAAGDNDAAANATSFANAANRSRERAAALSEVALQGAGESDALRSQMMSLKTWSANQGESNRSFFDTLRSVNSSLSDLNVDTKTARLNAESQMNNDKDQLYTTYFNQRSEAYTQLGNLRGQQAELHGLANEQVGSKASKKAQKQATKQSGRAFDRAADMSGEAWKNPGASAELLGWQGEAEIQGRQNTSLFANAATNIAPPKKPEGATLRKWS